MGAGAGVGPGAGNVFDELRDSEYSGRDPTGAQFWKIAIVPKMTTTTDALATVDFTGTPE